MFATPDLTERLARSDSALANFRTFQKNHLPGQLWGVAGLILLGTAQVAAAQEDDNFDTLAIVLTFGSIVPTFVSGRKHQRAQQALARAMWWYNRDLPR